MGKPVHPFQFRLEPSDSVATSQTKRVVLPVIFMTIGLVLFVGCAVAMYIAGVVIDEQRIDSNNSLDLLWLGLAIGPVITILGAVWLAVQLRKR